MDTRPITWQGQWEDFVKYLTGAFCERGNKDGPAWIPALFGETPNANGSLRYDGNVKAITALVLDLDGKDRYYKSEELCEAFDGYLWVAHTTYSYTPQEPRWRVVFPLQDPIPPERLRDAYTCFWQQFGIRGDAQCLHPSRLYYLPACPPQRGKFFCLLKGWGKPYVPLYTNRGIQGTNPSYSTTTILDGGAGGLIGTNFDPEPTYQPCHKRVLPKGNGKGWMWPEAVKRAVANAPALRVGYRNARWQLTLARALLRCPVAWDRTKLRLVFSRWYRANHHAIRTCYQISYKEFLEAFLRCPDQKPKLDVDRLRKVAKTFPVPAKAERLRPKLRLALQACLCLQQWHGQDPFFITTEAVGKLLGYETSPKTAGDYCLKRLVALGYIEQTSQGSNFTGKANTYRIKEQS